MTSYSITPHPWRTKAYALALKGMFRLSPERIHGIISTALRVLQATPRPVNRLVGKIVQVNDPILSQEVFGTVFPQPLGLAAGFDKNGRLADVWHTIGFGYAELGTVTAAGQPGNPTPRLFRLPKDKAILNRMGFNNEERRMWRFICGTGRPAPWWGLILGKPRWWMRPRRRMITAGRHHCWGI